MPKKEINYQKSVIYKIEHLENPELLYVGSTTDFTKRKNHHKFSCNNENNRCYNLKVYKMIRENGGWESFKIMIIKQYPCNSKIDLLIEEDKLMKELRTSLNQNKAYQTDEERIDYKKKWFQLNKESTKEHRQEYSKEYQNEYDKKKYICICGSEILLHNKCHHIKTKKHITKLQTI